MQATDVKKSEKTAYEKYIDGYFNNLFLEYPQLQKELRSIHSFTDWKNLAAKYPNGKLPDFLLEYVPDHLVTPETPTNNPQTREPEKEDNSIHHIAHLQHTPHPTHEETMIVPSSQEVTSDEDSAQESTSTTSVTQPVQQPTTSPQPQQQSSSRPSRTHQPNSNNQARPTTQKPTNLHNKLPKGSGLAGKIAKKLASQLGKQAAKAGAKLLFGTPAGWIILAVLLILLIVFLIILGGKGKSGNPTDKTAGGTTSNAQTFSAILSGDNSKVSIAGNFNYTLNIQYQGSNNLTVIAPLPQGFNFSSSSITPTTITPTDLTWILTPSQASAPLTFSIIPNSPGLSGNITEGAISVDDGSGSGSQSTTTAQANNNNCGGIYTNDIAQNPMQKNFGDPNCSFDKTKLMNNLTQQDPNNAYHWFIIVSCESSYDPNVWTDHIVDSNGNYIHTPDPNGAWGLFQMGSDSNNTGQGLNGIYDRGDVNWQQQINNAINYNKIINGSFNYWGTKNKTSICS